MPGRWVLRVLPPALVALALGSRVRGFAGFHRRFAGRLLGGLCAAPGQPTPAEKHKFLGLLTEPNCAPADYRENQEKDTRWPITPRGAQGGEVR